MAVDALVARHVKRHGDAARSLAAITAGRSVLQSLATLADEEPPATLGRVPGADDSTLAGQVDETLRMRHRRRGGKRR